MDILIFKTETPVEREKEKTPRPFSGKARERRKAKRDRRRSVNEGIYVQLSAKKERRRQGDRRKNRHKSTEPATPESFADAARLFDTRV